MKIARGDKDPASPQSPPAFHDRKPQARGDTLGAGSQQANGGGVPVVINHAVDQRFPTVMAITISRFCEFYVRESGRVARGSSRLRATAGGVAARGATEKPTNKQNSADLVLTIGRTRPCPE